MLSIKKLQNYLLFKITNLNIFKFSDVFMPKIPADITKGVDFFLD